MEVQKVKSVVVEYAYSRGRFIAIFPRPLYRQAYVVQYDDGAPFGWASRVGQISLPVHSFAIMALSDKAVAKTDAEICIGEKENETYLLLHGKWLAKFEGETLQYVIEDVNDYSTIITSPGSKRPDLEEVKDIEELKKRCEVTTI